MWLLNKHLYRISLSFCPFLFSWETKSESSGTGLFLDWVRTGLNRFGVGLRQSFRDISFSLRLLSSCLPTLRLPSFYTLHLSWPPLGLFVIGCAGNWLNWLKFVNAAAGLFVLPTPPPLSLLNRCASDCCDLAFYLLPSRMPRVLPPQLLPSRERLPPMPAAGRAEGEDDAEEHGGARRWGRRKVTPVWKQSKGLEEEHMIVETEHLLFCSGYFREELLATSRFLWCHCSADCAAGPTSGFSVSWFCRCWDAFSAPHTTCTLLWAAIVSLRSFGRFIKDVYF